MGKPLGHGLPPEEVPDGRSGHHAKGRPEEAQPGEDQNPKARGEDRPHAQEEEAQEGPKEHGPPAPGIRQGAEGGLPRGKAQERGSR